MPATNFPEYAREIEDVLDAAVAAGEATLVSIQIDQRSSLRGFITSVLQEVLLADESSDLFDGVHQAGRCLVHRQPSAK